MKILMTIVLALIAMPMPFAGTPTLHSPDGASIGQTPVIGGRSNLLFDQTATGNYAFCASQWDSVLVFDAEIADNFSSMVNANVDSLVWWGGYWSPGPPGTILDFAIKIYNDSTGFSQPQQLPVYSERVPFTETDLGSGVWFQYSAVIPSFAIDSGLTYWIEFQAQMIYPPQWGNECSWPANTPGWGDGQQMYFKSVYFSYPTWTLATSVFGASYPYESSFLIYGTPTGIAERPGSQISSKFGFNSVIPNPSRGNASISYTIEKAGLITLKIYDGAGRLIRTLITANETPGTKSVAWNGKADDQHSVSEGVYFLKLQSGDDVATRQMILIK